VLRSRLRPRAARWFQRRLLARATDVTATIGNGSALILAPHADDEAIGCGALIARKTAAGASVTVVIATDGRNAMRSRETGSVELARIRRLEALEAGAALGVPADAIRFLDFEDGTLDRQRDALRSAVERIVAELDPDEVYAPHADAHPDHRTLSEVATQLLGRIERPRLFEYPVRYWTRVPWIDDHAGRLAKIVHLLRDPIDEWRRPPAVVIRSDGYAEQKLAALAAYAGEMRFVGSLAYPYAQSGYEVFFPVAAPR
jgi:LmbE family N-acetylglucosaminyl deacetylase